MGEPRDPSDTRRDFQNTNSSSGTHASARQRKGTSLSTKTSAPSPPSPDERSKKLCAANKRNTRATDSNSVLKYGLETVTRNPHRDCLTKSPTVGSSEVRRAVCRVHACLEYIQQIETCAVAEILWDLWPKFLCKRRVTYCHQSRRTTGPPTLKRK